MLPVCILFLVPAVPTVLPSWGCLHYVFLFLIDCVLKLSANTLSNLILFGILSWQQDKELLRDTCLHCVKMRGCDWLKKRMNGRSG